MGERPGSCFPSFAPIMSTSRGRSGEEECRDGPLLLEPSGQGRELSICVVVVPWPRFSPRLCARGYYLSPRLGSSRFSELCVPIFWSAVIGVRPVHVRSMTKIDPLATLFQQSAKAPECLYRTSRFQGYRAFDVLLASTRDSRRHRKALRLSHCRVQPPFDSRRAAYRRLQGTRMVHQTSAFGLGRGDRRRGQCANAQPGHSGEQRHCCGSGFNREANPIAPKAGPANPLHGDGPTTQLAHWKLTGY